MLKGIESKCDRKKMMILSQLFMFSGKIVTYLHKPIMGITLYI